MTTTGLTTTCTSVCSLVLALGACGGSDSGVSGSARTVWVTADGEQEQMDDLSGLEVEALVDNGDGTFARFDGVVGEDGTFDVPDAPDGEVYVRFGTAYYVVDGGGLDFVSAVVQRPDAEVLTSASDLAFEVSGASAEPSGSSIEIAVPTNALWLYGTLDPDATTYAETIELVAAYEQLYGAPPLRIDGSAGDRVWVTQLTPVDLGDDAVLASTLQRAYQADPFDQTPGEPVTVSGAFTEPTETGGLSATWRAGAFLDTTAAGATVGAEPTSSFATLSIYSNPFGTDHGAFALGSMSLASVNSDGSGDATLDLTWRDPFPSDWAPVLSGFAYELHDVGGAYISIIASIEAPLADIGDTIEPLVAPISDLRIDGSDASMPVTGTGPTPTLTWSAPTTGASWYRVSVRLIDDNSDLRVASIVTRDTEVRIPPGILDTGNSYAFVITAISAPDDDFADTRMRGITGRADYLSALLEP